MTTMSIFDAAAWLRDFEAVGGTFSTLPDGEWFIGWRLDRELDDAKARNLYSRVKDRPDRIAAVKAAVEARRAR